MLPKTMSYSNTSPGPHCHPTHSVCFLQNRSVRFILRTITISYHHLSSNFFDNDLSLVLKMNDREHRAESSSGNCSLQFIEFFGILVEQPMGFVKLKILASVFPNYFQLCKITLRLHTNRGISKIITLTL